MSTEVIVVALLATAVAVIAVWRPNWVWAPIAALAAFLAYVFGSGDDSDDSKPEPHPGSTTSKPNHTPENRSDTKIDIARDDDVSDDLGDELDRLDAEHESWRDRWLRSSPD